MEIVENLLITIVGCLWGFSNSLLIQWGLISETNSVKDLPTSYTVSYVMVATYHNSANNYVFTTFIDAEKTMSNYRLIQRSASGKSTGDAYCNWISIGY